MAEKQSWSTENMAAAIEDVNKGMTYKEAARAHKVPFSILQYRHKRAKKRGLFSVEAAQKIQNLWSEENMAAAIEDVNKGMTYRKAAKTHKVPLSTLQYRDKEAKKRGLSPLEAAQKIKKIKTCWSEENMAAAIKDVMKGKISSRRADALHNVPRSALISRIRKAKKESLSSLKAAPKHQEIQDDEAHSVISGNNETHSSTFAISSTSPSQEEKNIQKSNIQQRVVHFSEY